MDIGKFLDENHIKEDIPVDNMYQPEMSDLIVEEKTAKKQEKTYQFTGWKKVFAQALMMGYHKKDILAKYNTNIKVAGNMEEAEKYLDQKDGLIGSIFVDCSCFDKTFDYNKCSSKLKKYHRFAINCHCQNVVSKSMRKNASDGTMDGILNEEPVKVVYKKQVCDKCGLPVISSLKEIPQNVLISIVDQLVASKEIGFNEGKKIKSSKNILASLRSIFANKVGQYKFIKTNTKVDLTASKYGLQAQNLEVIPVTNLNSLIVEQNPDVYESVLKIDKKPQELNGVKMEVYVPEVDLQKKQDQITFDNQEYIDKEWFGNNDIEFEQEQFDPEIQSLDGVKMDVYIPEVEVNKKQDNSMLKDVDQELLSKDAIEIKQKDMNKPQILDNLEVKEYKPEVEIEKEQSPFEEVKMDVYIPEVELNKYQDEIMFDNQEYIDKQWFDKEDIELQDKDFVSKKKDIKIKNDFRFDF